MATVAATGIVADHMDACPLVGCMASMVPALKLGLCFYV